MNQPNQSDQDTIDERQPEQFTLRQVDFRSVFEFSLLFRAFRVAIEPSCLLAALLAIGIIYTAGRAFDVIWGPQVLAGEIRAFHIASSARPATDYSALLAQDRAHRQNVLLQLLRDSGASLADQDIDRLSTNPEAAFKFLRRQYERQFHATLASLQAIPSAGPPAPSIPAQRRQAAALLWTRIMALRHAVGYAPFDALLHFETRQFSRLVETTLGFFQIRPTLAANPMSPPQAHLSTALLPHSNAGLWRSDTVGGCLANMFVTGPCWFAAGAAPVHEFPGETAGGVWLRRIGYEAGVLVLVLIAFLMAALSGAFICRYTALTIAGQNPDIKSVLPFAWRRLAVFIKAPLLPFLTMAGMGLILVLLALLGAIPFVGEILVGAGFILFLFGGFVIMLMILGLLGGASLIYPALAVDGADSFDAISRSFSYLYSRPWRMLFYGLLALFYGVATYLFLSFALYVLLAATHLLVGWGMDFFGLVHGWYSGQGKLDTLWAAPTFGHLIGPINWGALNVSEFIGAAALYFWLYLAVSLLGAYVIAYFFVVNTIIYLLLRRQVDGQSPHDIYLEPRRL